MGDNRFEKRRDSRGGSFNKGPKDRHSGPVTLHDATCGKCGKDCQVPFKPTGERPVYCGDCFERPDGRENYRSNDRAPRREFKREAVRESGDGLKDHTIKQLSDKIDGLNTRLDTIIRMVTEMSEEMEDELEDK